MAASAFVIFDKAKEYLMDGTIDLDTNTFNITFWTSATALSAGIASTLTQLASAATQVSSGNGYAAGGAALTGVTWGSGASAGQKKFDASDYVITASGGQIENIKYAVIHEASSGAVLCYSRLTDTQFTLADGSTLTVQFNASGIFTLT